MSLLSYTVKKSCSVLRSYCCGYVGFCTGFFVVGWNQLIHSVWSTLLLGGSGDMLPQEIFGPLRFWSPRLNDSHKVSGEVLEPQTE